MRPDSCVYFASSENWSALLVMSPPQGMAVSGWTTALMVVGNSA